MHGGGLCDIGQKVDVITITEISISGGYRNNQRNSKEYEIKTD
jgi:hypothetical protein